MGRVGGSRVVIGVLGSCEAFHGWRGRIRDACGIICGYDETGSGGGVFLLSRLNRWGRQFDHSLGYRRHWDSDHGFGSELTSSTGYITPAQDR